MQRKNNIGLRLHRQRRPEQVLLPIVLEDNGEALRVILEKQDNVTAEFLHKTEKKVRSGWLKLEIEQDGCREAIIWRKSFRLFWKWKRISGRRR